MKNLMMFCVFAALLLYSCSKSSNNPVNTTPSVTLTSPKGGEKFNPGDTTNISWTYVSITNIKIELSTDAGSTFPTTLIASTPAAAGSWQWIIPSSIQSGTTFKIRLSDASNPSVNSVSAGNFSIDNQQYLSLLTKVKVNIDSNVTYMFTLLKNTVNQLTMIDSDTNVRTYIKGWFNNVNNLVEALYIDASGKYKFIEPSAFSSFEGTDISSQALFTSVKSTNLPGISGYSKTIEGYYGLELEYPRVNTFGVFLGVFSMKINPVTYFGTIIENLVKTNADDFFLMQPDGTIFYEEDNAILKLTGKNLLTDPAFQSYPDFKTAGTQIVSISDGKAAFTYLDKNGKSPVNKTVWWTSLTYYGTSWRLCLVKEG